MKRRRNSDDSASSFDLFLDTICNTFGGIVFLAILLAVMVQNRSVVQSKQSDAEQASPDEIREAMGQLTELTAKSARLQTTLAALPSKKPEEAEDSTLSDLAEALETIQLDATSTLESEAKKSQDLTAILEKNADQRIKNDAVLPALEATKKRLTKLESDYKALVQSQQQTLRLPRVQTSRAASVLVLVQGGQLYLAKSPSLYGKGFNSQQVSTRTLADTGIEIVPIPGTGWDIGNGDAIREFRSIIQKAVSQSNFITLVIWPDSFDQFAKLRTEMIDGGIVYQLWPKSTSEVLKIYLGGGKSRVQ